MDKINKPATPTKENTSKDKKDPPKKEKYEGYRWSSLLLFFLTILAGALFYLTGEH